MYVCMYVCMYAFLEIIILAESSPTVFYQFIIDFPSNGKVLVFRHLFKKYRLINKHLKR